MLQACHFPAVFSHILTVEKGQGEAQIHPRRGHLETVVVNGWSRAYEEARRQHKQLHPKCPLTPPDPQSP